MYSYNTHNVGSRPFGIGVEGFGFDKPQTDPLYQPIPARRSVWSQIFSTAPQVVHQQQVTPVGLTGNGSISGIQGQMALSALADFEAKAQKGEG